MAHFGMNLRVTMDSKQGGRKYMEDVLAVKFQKTDDGRNIEYTYLAVFDGHGGVEAAKFAKEHLLIEITKLKGFWSDDDEEVTQAIREGFLSTHRLMWKAVGTWPKTLTGYPSTAGTTASVVFIRNGKMYVAHVGDSTVVMGMKAKAANAAGDAEEEQEQEQEEDVEEPVALAITDDHKPDAPKELKRIEEGGGQVVAKAGVQRVVWHRPKLANGPVRRSTNVDSIPFLAIARALGDLWSYNAANDTFVVSPDPDIATFCINLQEHKFIILASDGLWNMVKPQEAVDIVHELDPQSKDPYVGRKPASLLLHIALDRWGKRMLRADNTSVIVAYFDPPGIHKDAATAASSLLRQPSDLSIASTLKATSDGEEDDEEEEEDDDDAELNEIFPSSASGIVGAEDEESHQATGSLSLYDRRKPALKRLPPSPANYLKHSRSSPVAPFAKLGKKGGANSAAAKVNEENDPNKVSIITVKNSGGKWSAKKRACSDEDIGIRVPHNKRACLASPESSHVADSPLAASTSSRHHPLHCSIPLQVELSAGGGGGSGAASTSSPLSSASSSTDTKLLSPLWPSHLADDLSDNAMCEPMVSTLIKPHCSSGSTKASSGRADDAAASSAAGSSVRSLQRTNGPSPSPLSSQNKPSPGASGGSPCLRASSSSASNSKQHHSHGQQSPGASRKNSHKGSRTSSALGLTRHHVTTTTTSAAALRKSPNSIKLNSVSRLRTLKNHGKSSS